RELRGQRGVGLCQRDDEIVSVDLHALDVPDERRRRRMHRRIESAVDREGEVLGGYGSTVAEREAALDADRVRLPVPRDQREAGCRFGGDHATGRSSLVRIVVELQRRRVLDLPGEGG